jgi:hypothetical protein
MKIQETIYELLNQQYELTRIQEAKEIPTIRVIDPANFPEKKSWPPRLLIILILTGTAFLGTMFWVIGLERWQNLSAHDPQKLLAISIGESAVRRARHTAARLHVDWISSYFLRSRHSRSR